MVIQRSVELSSDPLMSVRERSDYNAAERWFSRILQDRLQDVLQAKRNRLELLRRYSGRTDRLGIMATPPGLPRDQLRLSVVEDMLVRAIDFVRSDSLGGPISQVTGPDGSYLEIQSFPTKFPHIIIQRADRFQGDSPFPVDTSWSLLRVQNQRQQTQVNRLFDVADLVFTMLRMIQ